MSTAAAPASRRSLLREVTRRLPLFLLVFIATPSTLAHNPFPVRVLSPMQLGSILASSSSPTSLTTLVPPGYSLTFALQPPNSTNASVLLLEAWYDPDEFLIQPEVALLASFIDIPPDTHPYKRHAVFGDFEAAWTKRNYHFIIFPKFERKLYVRLLHHYSHLKTDLNTTIRVSLHQPSESLCPFGPGNETCSGKGACRVNECNCQSGYGGRYCENEVNPLPATSFDVPSERMEYFNYVVPQNGSIAVVMHIKSYSANIIASQPILFAKRLGENGGTLDRSTPLPSIFDREFSDAGGVLGRQRMQTVVRSNMRAGEILYIGVYNMRRTLWLSRGNSHFSNLDLLPSDLSVRVTVDAFPCKKRFINEGEQQCPPENSQQQWEVGLNFLLLPLLLSMLILLTMVVCVSVWASVFRQQFFGIANRHQIEEFSTQPDKLSEAEVNAMFPAFVFTKNETAALGATGDVCCSVCLCSFEEGEFLRRLACGHSYHSSCLDQWLLTNATCPRCRKPARIHGEMVRSSMSRRTLRAFTGLLRSLFARVSSRLAVFRGRPNVQDEDVEVALFYGGQNNDNRQFGADAL
ncbi:unnamed protein product [Agarophyton chilense]|eukprot:gb/GEZJ01002728.1/.p1 GENE.gb/GEZJ01002728.1/~~gb/GEZJ01002728.1/.p1  ORF type:complete len:578 (+),score=57.69 gb/GEZJ01002728.1/:159-1892(+)